MARLAANELRNQKMPDDQNPLGPNSFGIFQHTLTKDGFLDEISGGISKMRLRLTHVDHSRLTEEWRQENKNAIVRADQVAFDVDTVREQFLKGLLTPGTSPTPC